MNRTLKKHLRYCLLFYAPACGLVLLLPVCLGIWFLTPAHPGPGSAYDFGLRSRAEEGLDSAAERGPIFSAPPYDDKAGRNRVAIGSDVCFHLGLEAPLGIHSIQRLSVWIDGVVKPLAGATRWAPTYTDRSYTEDILAPIRKAISDGTDLKECGRVRLRVPESLRKTLPEGEARVEVRMVGQLGWPQLLGGNRYKMVRHEECDVSRSMLVMKDPDFEDSVTSRDTSKERMWELQAPYFFAGL